jgi:peptidoglycan glycosyltransferase
MNTQIRRLGIGLLACYVALFVMLNWIQVFHREALNNHPLNTLRVKAQFNKPRGTITSADGALLAESVAVTDGGEFKLSRHYPEADLFGQLTGYYSFAHGSSGLERQYDDQLTGQTIGQQIRGFADLLNPRSQVGNLTLTVRKDLQQVAKQALGERAGSVVALDPRSGEILAFWSYPSFDPNLVSSLDGKVSDFAWGSYNADSAKPLLAHQYQEIYFPGSTFKVVTGSTGLQTGAVTVDDPSYAVARSYTPPQTTKPISNFGGEACGGKLYDILRISCNSAFAQMGTETIGPDGMIHGAESFGFNSRPPIDLPAAEASYFPSSFKDDLPALAQSSIGQRDVQATPLQMALVAAAVANGGVIMKPHVVREVRDSEGTVIEHPAVSRWLQPLSAANADLMRVGMLGVVDRGTATAMKISGFEVGGKTGTAQLGTATPRSHTWIVGFAGPVGGTPEIAIAVVVLDQPGASEATGGRVAAPIAKQVLQAYLAAPNVGPTGN